MFAMHLQFQLKYSSKYWGLFLPLSLYKPRMGVEVQPNDVTYSNYTYCYVTLCSMKCNNVQQKCN